jgi:transcriptional regulator with XRE-family HTH domain
MVADEGIGTRIRRYRRSRGMSLDQAAGLVGISKPYLSRLECGERPVDSRSLLDRIAAALEVPLSDLTGQPGARRSRDHDYLDARRGVTGVRLALLDPGGPPVSDEQIRVAFGELDQIRHSCNLVKQAQIVPNLLRWTQQSAAGGSIEAHRRVVQACYAAMFLMRNLGEFDLAWMAADRLGVAAEEVGTPEIQGFAAYARAHALTPAGALRRAAEVAMEGVDASSAASPEQKAARGSCLLVAASTLAAIGDVTTARALLDDAALLASRLDAPTAIAKHTSFAQWNVTMHKVSVEVESGNPADAIKAASPLLTGESIKYRERMSYFWVDLGRAYSQMDRHRDAIESFRRAERSAPLRVRLSPVVQDSVRELLSRSHRRAGGAELRGLAERCGVLGNPGSSIRVHGVVMTAGVVRLVLEPASQNVRRLLRSASVAPASRCLSRGCRVHHVCPNPARARFARLHGRRGVVQADQPLVPSLRHDDPRRSGHHASDRWPNRG